MTRPQRPPAPDWRRPAGGGAGPGAAAAWVAAALVQGAMVGGGPRVGELDDQAGEVVPGTARWKPDR
jgi:hypothetical protein